MTVGALQRLSFATGALAVVASALGSAQPLRLDQLLNRIEDRVTQFHKLAQNVVCIERSVKTHDAIAAAGRYGVSILSSGQADISSRFASRRDDKFDGVELIEGALDVPLIAGALTAIECRLYDRLPGGDHTIFIGEVMNIHTTEGDPLLYFRSGYREMRS